MAADSPVSEVGERKKMKKRGKEESIIVLNVWNLLLHKHGNMHEGTTVKRSRRNAGECTQGKNILVSGNLKMNGHKKKSVG